MKKLELDNLRLDELSPIFDYGITIAAKVLGCSATTIVNFEKRGVIPKARRLKDGLRKDRIYSTKELEQIRDYIREYYYNE